MSLLSFVAWLETQRASTKYDWYNVDGCLACRYIEAMGLNILDVRYRDVFNGDVFLYHDICKNGEWTYGAALARARQKLSHSTDKGT